MRGSYWREKDGRIFIHEYQMTPAERNQKEYRGK